MAGSDLALSTMLLPPVSAVELLRMAREATSSEHQPRRPGGSATASDQGTTVAASLQAPTLFLIAQDLTKMQVDTSIDESDVERVRVAQPVTFTVGSISGRAFSGQVVQVRKAPLVLQNVVTYDVVVSTANPDPQSPAGHDGQRPDHHRPERHRAQGAERRTALSPTGSGDGTRPNPGGRTGSRSGWWATIRLRRPS